MITATKNFLLIAAIAFWSGEVVAAPCCSANAASPALISGDDSAQLTLMTGQSTTIGDAFADGLPVFRAGNDREISQTLRIDGAFLVSDRWQLGGSLPLLRHAIARPGIDDSATSLGDVRLNAAYEFLPEWSYSKWKPKGLLFAQIILPTSRSIYESTAPGGVDSLGQGFFIVAAGSLLLKRWGNFDSYFMPEIHYSFARDFHNSDLGEAIHVGPNWGGSAALGAGISPGGGNFRLGVRVQPMIADRKKVTSSTGDSWTSYQLSWDTALEASYLVADDWSVTAGYTDQTLLGPAVNSMLSRTFTLAVQKRWAR